jgi:hypothetical protein
LNVAFLADDQAAASTGFNDDVLVQPHAPAEFHRARGIIRLVNQDMIADKDMRSEVQMAVIQSGTRRNIAPLMHR